MKQGRRCRFLQGCLIQFIIAESSRRPYRMKMRQFTTALQFGTHIYSYAPSHEDTGSKSSSGEIMRKTLQNTCMAALESQNQK